MQIIRLPPGNMSWIIQIRNLFALKVLDHEVRIDDLPDVCVKYFTRRTDHDLDHLESNLPLREVVQDLYSTDPTQETRPIDHAGYMTPIRQHELDHTDQEIYMSGNI